MPRRFDAGPATALLGAAVLAVSLFVDWYDPGVSAWGAFESLDVLLLALAALAAAAVLAPGGPNGRLMLGASLAAFVVVVTQLIQPPPIIDATGGGLRLGAWLALVGTLLAALGSVLAVAAISINVDVAGRDARRRATAVDRRAGGRREAGDLLDEDDSDDDLDAPRPARAPRPGGASSVASAPAARRPESRPSGGSLFSRGPVRDEDEPEDTVTAPIDPQATQAFTRVDDEDEDDRPATRPGR